MPGDLKARIAANTFVTTVRNSMRFDEAQYEALCQLLRQLAITCKCESQIDRELALSLYTIPQAVRNAFLSFGRTSAQQSEIASRLEDAWIELDGLVLECLSGRSG